MKRILKKTANAIETSFDQLTEQLSVKLMADGKVHFHPYNGMGNSERIFMRGRVLRDKEIPKPKDEDSFVRNLLNTWQHATSDEIPNVRVKATISGKSDIFTTDEEGYFLVEMENPGLDPDQLWHPLELELIDRPDHLPVEATAQILIPKAEAKFGIISDIDDTVLQSRATSYVAAASLMFFKNAKTRMPFDGVAELYKAMQQNEINPLFYVSSSPWNLYELLTDFFDYQDIPKGPLFLADYGFSADQFIKPSHGNHKLEQIEHVLSMYPSLNFILMGDSGQKDPEIYQKAIAKHPGRILAAYIRDVTRSNRDKEVIKIAEAVTQTGVPMIFTEDSNTILTNLEANQWL
ncbi:MAG: phosphatase domain-containing protein [Chloroflexota bacterium]